MLKLGIIVAAGIVVLVLLLYLFQHRMIYFPRRYHDRLHSYMTVGVREVRYRTKDGEQVSYFFGPTNPEQPPKRVWMLFGGNASLALHWHDRFAHEGDADGYLAVEYPGYGQSEGSASPESIAEATEQAVVTLADMLQVQPGDLRISVLGHSLGAAAALQYASRHRVERIVLIAPFTSMRDMAQVSVGPLLSRLLRHHFDNRQRLQEILNQADPPPVTIIHGDQDDIIPVEMGRELDSLFAGRLVYHEISGGDHNRIMDEQHELLRQVMNGVPVVPHPAPVSTVQ